MKQLIIAFCLTVLLGSPLYSIPADVVYTEGEATIKYQTGDEYEAYIGDVLDTGDAVTTDFDGFVELDRSGVIIKINPDTVFTLLEREENKEKTDVLSVVLGSIKFKYGRITGREPKIQTPSCIAGVRGTEFEVFAGVDGSSLITVDSGQLTVESEGESVELASAEGVEVQPGEAPGEKFEVLIGKMDYQKWNEGKLQALLKDPIKATQRAQERMSTHIKEIEKIYPLFLEKKDQLGEERVLNRERKEKEGVEASQKYYHDVIFPLEIETSNLVLNIRYYALSALSLRRYVLGRIYLTLKSKYIMDLSNASFIGFLELYKKALKTFENSIVPHLVEFDI